MTVYAHILNGIVSEIIEPLSKPDGTLYDISERFVPSMVENMVAVPDGTAVSQGYTYANGAFAAPAVDLTPVIAHQISYVTSEYNQQRQLPITYKLANGTSTTFQADDASQSLLQSAATVFGVAGSVPSGFTWNDATNTPQAVTLADIQGISMQIAIRTSTLYWQLQSLKTKIRALTDIDSITGVTWSTL
jgi:hypothetical protein